MTRQTSPGSVRDRGHVSFSGSAWTWVVVACAVWTLAVSWIIRFPCHQLQWGGQLPQVGACYSDLPHLYERVGMVHGQFPYLDSQALLEYPILQSVIATTTGVVSWLITPSTSVHVGQSIYFDVNALTLLGVWVAIVLLMSRMLPNPKVVLALALAPAVAATGLINWDLWVVLATVIALYFLRQERWAWGGVFLGIGTALKLWPFLLLGAVIVLGVRRRQWRPSLVVAGTTFLTWLVINLPFLVWDREQWSFFWSFSSDRGAGFSSVYHVWNVAVGPALGLGQLSADVINVIAYGGFALCCLAVLGFGLIAPEEPKIEQLSLLIVAAFVLTNKVYSPQFVLWLVPLVLLARPKVVGFLIWQVIEVFHWIAIFSWINTMTWNRDALPEWTTLYVLAVLAHVVAVVTLCGLVLRDGLTGRAPDAPGRRTATVSPGSTARAGALREPVGGRDVLHG